ncbi:MAG: hypothetical protein AAFQ68_12930 [Bacteroidota bacterium]
MFWRFSASRNAFLFGDSSAIARDDQIDKQFVILIEAEGSLPIHAFGEAEKNNAPYLPMVEWGVSCS